MRVRLWTLPLLAAGASLAAQQPSQPAVSVRVSAEGQMLAHAQVRVGGRGAETNAAGLARLSLAPGSYVITVSLLGYKPDTVSVAVRRDTLLNVELEPVATELSGIVVNSARGAQRIEAEPLRVEVLGGDDVAEKTEMRPSDLTKFLTEMAGIRVQQLSAATAAASVRMQGLRPRYTLLLADGLPLYGSGGTGLDLLQLPPADLRQIEVVKGPASALYGASALGGMINLISKRPGHEGDLLLHGSSEAGANTFAWTSREVSDRFGYTVVAGGHAQKIRDMDGDGWADVPGVTRGEIRPRLYFDWPAGHSLFLTVGGTSETRDGGIVKGRTAPDGSAYAEQVKTTRGDAGVVAHRLIGGTGLLQWRASANADKKERQFGTTPEDVTKTTGFSELSYANGLGNHDLLIGGAIENQQATIPQSTTNEFSFTTASAFAQDAWALTSRFSLTGSVRADHHSRYGTQVSPRLSTLLQIRKGWTARVSATHGFYAPTPFIEEAEAVGLQKVSGFAGLDVETAEYVGLDVNGKQGPVELNGSLFASTVHDQVTATPLGATLQLANAVADASTRGAELFAVYDLEPLFITALYTYTKSQEPVDDVTNATKPASYLPRHTGGIDVTWEDAAHGLWIAVEGFYSGTQALDRDANLTEGKPYTVVGALVSKHLGRYKVFLNIENLTNVRQTDYEPLLLPARRATGEWTNGVWAPLEGRVFSLGLRISTGDLVAH